MIELHQFPFSHYNEKARWALDWKGVPHLRRSYMPALHVLPIWRLSGQRSVPVLRAGDEVVAGSAAIVDWLERRHPEPALLPADARLRGEALAVQRWFDEEVGPQIRRAFFHDFLPDGDYAVRAMLPDRPAATVALYRALFPMTRAIMRLDMGIDTAGAERGRRRVAEALDRVAAAGDGPLVGDRFSVADLAAAAILSPAVFPPESPVTLPEPRAAGLQTWLARWAGHPGVGWVARTFARHRGRSAALASG